MAEKNNNGAITEDTLIKLPLRLQIMLISFIVAAALTGFGWWYSANAKIKQIETDNIRQDSQISLIKESIDEIKGQNTVIIQLLKNRERSHRR